MTPTPPPDPTTDRANLRKLAEAALSAQGADPWTGTALADAEEAFYGAANPQAVIGLLDERDRLHDLVRHQRGPLHDAGLLTDEEYAALAADHGAVGRLETIDQLRADLAALRIEHAAWGAIIDGLRASLACARQDIDRARSAARIVGFLDAAVLIDDESTFDLTTALSEYINLDAMSVDGRARAIGVAEAAVAFAVRAIRAHADHLSKSESARSES